MNEIILHGSLEKYGPIPPLMVSNAAEAFAAIGAQIKGFLEEIRDGVWILVRENASGEFCLGEEHLLIGMTGSKLHVYPAVGGAGNGTKGAIKTVIGVAIIVASFVAAPYIGPTFAAIGVSIGLSLVFSGVALMLTPTPKNSSSKNDSSFLFNGDSNPAAQNLPVPLTYGRDRVKAIPVATQIVTNEYQASASVPINNTFGGYGSGASYGGGGLSDFSGQVRVANV